MMISVDKYLSKKHDMRQYNCWDFIREAWLEITGEDIGHRTPSSGSRADMIRRFQREEQEFQRLDKCEDPCIVLFLRENKLPHVGIYIRGRVLHLPEKNYAKYEKIEIVSMCFKEVKFYKCKKK